MAYPELMLAVYHNINIVKRFKRINMFISD